MACPGRFRASGHVPGAAVVVRPLEHVREASFGRFTACGHAPRAAVATRPLEHGQPALGRYLGRKRLTITTLVAALLQRTTPRAADGPTGRQAQRLHEAESKGD